jgi:hypothetical protein
VSRVIYKYDFDTRTCLQLTLCNPQIVLIAQQSGALPTVWIEQDLDRDPDTVLTLAVFGTGHAIPEGVSHVGSAVCGPFVWHVYSKREEVQR